MRSVVVGLVFAVACSSPAKSTRATPPPPDAQLGAVAADATYEVVTRDVTFTAGGRPMSGTLTAPRALGKWPAVLLLAGSGPTDRDWNNPLIATKNGSGALLATELAKHGAVVLRFDKAGTGKNPAPPLAQFTLDTYREEAVAGLAFLRAWPEVRGDRVFVAGHSEGGIHATRLAAVAQPPLAGVIYLASASRSMVETVLTQIEAQLRNPLAMLSDRAVELEMDSLRTVLTEFLAGHTVNPQDASKIPELQQLVAQLVAPAAAKLLRPLIGFDNAHEAAKGRGPCFVWGGGKDIQIDPTLDAKRLDKALRAAGREVTLHVSPDADHVLKHEPRTLEQIRAAGQASQDAYNAPGRVLDADFVQALVGWLAAHTR